MDTLTISYIIFTAFALTFAAFLAAAETAVIAVSQAVLHKLKSEGNQRAITISKLREDKDKLISTLLMANSGLCTVASSLGIAGSIRLFGIESIPIVTAIMAVLVILISEVIPKTYAFEYADRVALSCAPMLSLTLKVLAPVTAAVLLVVRYFFKALGIKLGNQKSMISEIDVLRGAIQLSHTQGGVIKYKKDMLDGVLDLGETTVSEVLTHRSKIVSIDVAQPIDEIIKLVHKSGHSRLPLWKDRPDNILGVVNIKDLFGLLQKKAGKIDKITEKDLLSVASDPWYVPDSTPLNDQLMAFRQKKALFALVIDEYGDFQGIITLKDILEEIIGKTYDEHDRSRHVINKTADGSYLINGTTTIRDINRYLELDLPDDNASTIAGLIMHESEIVPEIGQEFVFYNIYFKIMRKHDNQITLIKVKEIQPENTDESSDE